MYLEAQQNGFLLISYHKINWLNLSSFYALHKFPNLFISFLFLLQLTIFNIPNMFKEEPGKSNRCNNESEDSQSNQSQQFQQLLQSGPALTEPLHQNQQSQKYSQLIAEKDTSHQREKEILMERITKMERMLQEQQKEKKYYKQLYTQLERSQSKAAEKYVTMLLEKEKQANQSEQRILQLNNLIEKLKSDNNELLSKVKILNRNAEMYQMQISRHMQIQAILTKDILYINVDKIPTGEVLKTIRSKSDQFLTLFDKIKQIESLIIDKSRQRSLANMSRAQKWILTMQRVQNILVKQQSTISNLRESIKRYQQEAKNMKETNGMNLGKIFQTGFLKFCRKQQQKEGIRRQNQKQKQKEVKKQKEGQRVQKQSQ